MIKLEEHIKEASEFVGRIGYKLDLNKFIGAGSLFVTKYNGKWYIDKDNGEGEGDWVGIYRGLITGGSDDS